MGLAFFIGITRTISDTPYMPSKLSEYFNVDPTSPVLVASEPILRAPGGGILIRSLIIHQIPRSLSQGIRSRQVPHR